MTREVLCDSGAKLLVGELSEINIFLGVDCCGEICVSTFFDLVVVVAALCIPALSIVFAADSCIVWLPCIGRSYYAWYAFLMLMAECVVCVSAVTDVIS